MNALRQEAEPEEIGPYKSKNTLGMAVAKVIRALPGTPMRETHVLGAVLSSMPQDKRDKLCKTVRDTRVRRSLIDDERKKRSDAIPNQTLELVHQFYLHDDISRMCPGKRDCISVKDSVTGKREHKQKRLLYLSLSESHQVFCREHGDIIGFTKFTELRLPYVKPMINQDQEVCMSKYHQNIALLANGLLKIIPAIPCNPVQC